jgi:hypothetical protein
MTPFEASLLKGTTPLIVYGLGIVCPAIPSFVWVALIGAIANGTISLAHLQEFMAAHNIQAYEEYPDENTKGQG